MRSIQLCQQLQNAERWFAVSWDGHVGAVELEDMAADYIPHITTLSRRLDELSHTLQAERSARLAMETRLRETAAEVATVRLQMEIRNVGSEHETNRSEPPAWRAELQLVEKRLADNLTAALELQQTDAAAHQQNLQQQQDTAAAEQRQVLGSVRRVAEEVQRRFSASEDREAELERERELWLLALQQHDAGSTHGGIAEAVRKLEARVSEVGKVTQQAVSTMGGDFARASARQAVAAVEDRLHRWEEEAHAFEEQIQRVHSDSIAQYGMFSKAIESRMSAVERRNSAMERRLGALQSTVRAISTMAAEAASAEADAAEADLRERDSGTGQLAGLSSASSHKQRRDGYSRAAFAVPHHAAQVLGTMGDAATADSRVDWQRLGRTPLKFGRERQSSWQHADSDAAMSLLDTLNDISGPGMRSPSIVHASPQGRYRWPGDGPASAADAPSGGEDRRYGEQHRFAQSSPPSSPPPQQYARTMQRAAVPKSDSRERAESATRGVERKGDSDSVRGVEREGEIGSVHDTAASGERAWIEEWSDVHGRSVYRHRDTGEATLSRPDLSSNGTQGNPARLPAATVSRTEYVSLTKSREEGFGLEGVCTRSRVALSHLSLISS